MIKPVINLSSSSSLPEPSKTALEHSNQLNNIILQNIKDNANWLSFRDFMNLALYHPQYGYYTSGSKKIGQNGDFITAPELGPLFTYGIKQQIAPILNNNPDFDILEFGAGTGKLAEDLLRHLDSTNNLPNKYCILEVSAELKDRQQKKLNKLPQNIKSKVTWLNRLPEDNSFNGIIIANEVVDAMPVQLFEISSDEISELGLKVVNNDYVWQAKPAEQNLQDYIEKDIIPTIKDTTEEISSYISEVNFMAQDWLRSISQCLSTGMIMIFDYGFPRHEYYHHDRNQGTLMCHYRHHAHHNPLLYPGLQDITAHVDFTALAEVAVENDLDVLSYLSQGQFLIANNIIDYLEQHQNDSNIFTLKQNLKKLTHESEMGELFKVLMLTKNLGIEYFEHLQHYDRRGML